MKNICYNIDEYVIYKLSARGKMKKRMDFVIFAAVVIALYAVSHITGIGCPIKFFTGISCGGCGMTRALTALVSLRIRDAFYYHPLVLVPPVYCVFYALRNKIGNHCFKIITGICAALFICVYVIRLINPSDNIVTADISNGIIIKLLKHFGGIV